MSTRIVVSARCVLPEAWEPDGFGGRQLRKAGRLDALIKAVVGCEAQEFKVDGYLFRFRKAGRGLPICTVTGPDLPIPFHMVVKGWADARSRAPAVVEAFRKGEVPDEGVFRREDDDAVRVRYAAPATT